MQVDHWRDMRHDRTEERDAAAINPPPTEAAPADPGTLHRVTRLPTVRPGLAATPRGEVTILALRGCSAARFRPSMRSTTGLQGGGHLRPTSVPGVESVRSNVHVGDWSR